MTHYTSTDSAPTTDWPVLLTGQALTCGLLGKLIYEYPEQGWLKTLVSEGVFDDIPFGAGQPDVAAGLQRLQSWTRALEAGGDFDAALDDLRVDYTRLFIGVGTPLAPPWESVHLSRERLMFQEVTIDVRGWYRRFGLEVLRPRQEPDDHAGLELAFVAHLAQQALAALTQGESARVAALLAAQQQFLEEHPLRWLPMWCEQVEQHAQTDFYRGMAGVTRGVLSELAADFERRPVPETMT